MSYVTVYQYEFVFEIVADSWIFTIVKFKNSITECSFKWLITRFFTNIEITQIIVDVNWFNAIEKNISIKIYGFIYFSSVLSVKKKKVKK